MFFKGIFFHSEKYHTALSKLCFLPLVHISFSFPFFCFIFPPYLGHRVTTENPESLFFPKSLQTFLMSKLQACHETWTQGRFPGFSFQSDVAHGSGSEDCFSIGAGMGNPLVQRKKRWKVYRLQCGKSSCRAASLPLLLKPGLVLCCSSHQLWQLSWIAVDHLKCFPCQLSSESCWNGSLLCSAHSLLAMPSWWLSPIPHFF